VCAHVDDDLDPKGFHESLSTNMGLVKRVAKPACGT
jgi:hypothetical protein